MDCESEIKIYYYYEELILLTSWPSQHQMNMHAQDPKSYRPISLLCVPFKNLERLTHSRIDPVVDSWLPRKQAGFRRGRSTVDQLGPNTTNTIHRRQLSARESWAVFLDVTSAYDTAWDRGLLRAIPDRNMVGFIMEMLSNRSFVVHTSDGQRSKLRRRMNDVPHGSVLSPMLFNNYISDIPETECRKYGYVDDLAILPRRPSWKEIEEGLNKVSDSPVGLLWL